MVSLIMQNSFHKILINKAKFYSCILCLSLLIVFLIPNLEASATEELSILNVSYDATRELYREYNQLFIKHWESKTGQKIIINQSHGGSGKQARSVIDGLEADVVTLALAHDIDVIAKKTGLISQEWQTRLPNNNAPYTSTIAFLVRKGNPKNIKDWDDLTKPGISVITPNPKTSGSACWNYLAAWGYVLLKSNGNEEQARDFVRSLYKNVAVLDSGSRGSTATFVSRGIGDVLINWENEILLAAHELGDGNFDIVVPSISIVAEPSVSVVDQIAKKHNTTQVAEAYLEYLYSPEAQEIAAKHYFRPSDKLIAEKYRDNFPDIKLFTLQHLIGDWSKVYRIHFAEGGIFDLIYQNK
jgi:sulfate transport system substrate-binding protein